MPEMEDDMRYAPQQALNQAALEPRQTRVSLDEIEWAEERRREVEAAGPNLSVRPLDPSNPDQAGDWYANQPGGESFFTDEEEEAYEAILWAMHAIQDMGLAYNVEEFIGHIHGLQAFVHQHVLHRLNPEYYSGWYTKEETDEQVHSSDPGS